MNTNKQYEIYCLYTDQINMDWSEAIFDQITFVKLGHGVPKINCNKHIRMSDEKWFHPIGPEWGEFEFYYSLFQGYRKGLVELPDYVGFIQAGMGFKCVEGKYKNLTIMDLIEDFSGRGQLNERSFISFQPRGFDSVYDEHFIIDPLRPDVWSDNSFENCLDTIVKDYNFILNQEMGLSTLRGRDLDMCCSFFMHKNIFIQMMDFLSKIIHDGRLNKLSRRERRQGHMAELYTAVFIGLSDLNKICFPLKNQLNNSHNHKKHTLGSFPEKAKAFSRSLLPSIFFQTYYFLRNLWRIHPIYWKDVSRYTKRGIFEVPPHKKDIGDEQRQIHFIWFTCKRDYQFLKISLKSLDQNKVTHIGRIHIVIDKKSPLGEEEKVNLQKCINQKLFFYDSYYQLSWGGFYTIVSEFYAYSQLVSETAENDWIAKIDSDVLFTSDNIFHLLLNSDAEVIGHPIRLFTKDTYLNYFQGGCYFIKSKAMARVLSQRLLTQFLRCQWKLPFYNFFDFPEDAFFSFTFEKLKFKSREIVLMEPTTKQIELYPFLYSKQEIESMTPPENLCFSMIHFHGIKDEMLRFNSD